MNQLDEQFFQRIQGAITTIQAWDADPLLLAECRLMIPFKELCNDIDGEYSEIRDLALSSNTAKFVQRLARFFKKRMTWINQPKCTICGSTNEKISQGTRGPETIEEREGGATRVEVYKCNDCNSITTFPRYNSVRKLLETWEGRCGEYANLFGLVCRSCGFETRYILDVTDHVWTEVYIPDYNNGTDCNWIMIDSCEGVIDENSMYEAGWGKDLSVIIAVSTDHIVDVTSRYTRKWNDPDFQARRRTIASSEDSCLRIVQQCNQLLRNNLDAKYVTQLDRRLILEENILQQYKAMTIWDKEYANGRISGSLAWKVSRQEAGKDKQQQNGSNNKNKTKSASSTTSFYVESYLARDPLNCNTVSIHLSPRPTTRHGAITISGVSCAMGVPGCASVVVLDEKYLGCILQSKSVTTIVDLANLVVTLPEHRIVIVHGKLIHDDNNLATTEEDDVRARRQLSELGGFDSKLALEGDGIMYVGQIMAHPDWTVCCSITNAPESGITIEANSNTSLIREMKLKTEKGVRPSAVIGRVSESVMPLQTQILANYKQKRDAFLTFLEKEGDNHGYSGYTTKKGSPIYVLGATAYPFNHTDAKTNADDTWHTFLLLPPPLVDPKDVGIVDSDNKDKGTGIPQFEIPIEDNFFVQHLGSEMLTKSGGGLTTVHTLDAIRNSRLVAFYFSAHWCGPCRSFTPMLAEMYEQLKSEYPCHGLEIVFVSSDRDATSFLNYYMSMPWLAIPFQTLGLYKQLLSVKYGVQGIPSLVVLDSMSGEIVVSTNQSRQEVAQACSRGDLGITALFKNWLERVPQASREMIEMLTISCAEPKYPNQEQYVPENPYLIRKESSERQLRIQDLVRQLMEDGMDEEEAMDAASAVVDISSESDQIFSLGESQANGLFRVSTVTERGSRDADKIAKSILSESGIECLTTVISTIIKYLENAKKSPWTSRFRFFNLSFKVADRITRVKGGISLIQALGIAIYGTSDDFVASIPIGCDLDELCSYSTSLLEKMKRESDE